MVHKLEIVCPLSGNVCSYMDIPSQIDGDLTGSLYITDLLHSLDGYATEVAEIHLKEFLDWFYFRVFQTKHTSNTLGYWKDLYSELERFMNDLEENPECLVILSK